MGNNVLTQIIIEAIYKDQASEPAKAMEKNLQATFDRIKGGLQVFGGLAATAYSLKKALDFGVECTKLAAKLDDLRLAYTNLSKAQNINADLMLFKMREAAKGVIDDLTLMQMANNALMLNLPITAENMALLVEAGRRLGKAMGIDARAGIESLILGIGRQSRQMLDNLGIVVKVEEANAEYAAALGKPISQLTEAEQKTAFYNAAMRAVQTNLKNIGPDIDTTSDRFARFGVNITNLKLAIGELFTTSNEFANWARNFSTAAGIVNTAAGLSMLSQKLKEVQQNMYTPQGFVTDFGTLQRILQEMAPTIKQMVPDEKLQRELSYFLNIGPREGQREYGRLYTLINNLLTSLDKSVEDLNRSPIKIQGNLPNDLKIIDTQAEKTRKTLQSLANVFTEATDIDSKIFALDEKDLEQSKQLYEQHRAMEEVYRQYSELKKQWAGEPIIPPITDFEKLKSVSTIMQGFADNLGQAVIYGQELGPAVVASLQAIAAQLISKAAVYAIMSMFLPGGMNVASFLTGGTSSSFWGFLLGGKFQEGGVPPVGVPYLVGEKGPELRIDTRPGVILPNQVLQNLGQDQSVQELRRLRADVQDLSRNLQQMKYSIQLGDREIYSSQKRIADSMARTRL